MAVTRFFQTPHFESHDFFSRNVALLETYRKMWISLTFEDHFPAKPIAFQLLFPTKTKRFSRSFEAPMLATHAFYPIIQVPKAMYAMCFAAFVMYERDMGVSINGGTPSYHPFRWDFPSKEPSINGGTPMTMDTPI